jgi:ligand-binding SRPBCC domain-containing protein
MPEYTYTAIINATPTAVSSFHADTSVLKRLTPPPIFAQIHEYEPLAEGSRSQFTLWFGPLPIRWLAIHADVGPRGFTDIQQRGPWRRWRHTHQFLPIGDGRTRIQDHIEFEHHPGLRGLLTRLLFPRPLLWLLFTYRRLVIKHGLESK